MAVISQRYHDVTINKTDIPQSSLNIEEKTRSNPLKWNGQFSPQLIDILLSTYASKTSVVFDPFLGSGTVLLECGSHKLSGIGTEINPAAYYLSNTYQFINVHPSIRVQHLNVISELLEHQSPSAWFQNLEQITPERLRNNLLHTVSEASNSLDKMILTALMILLDPYETKFSTEIVFSAWRKLKQHLIQLPFSEREIVAFHADARAVPIAENSIDIVITSPPYINVFNYHQQYRRTIETLNWEILEIAKSEIGSNRKHRGNRFLTVIQYCLDIAQVLSELQRVCHDNARIILVVGRESAVRGTAFFNGEIVTEIAEYAANFKLETRQERSFYNRFGTKIYEDILHFRPMREYLSTNYVTPAREIALRVLQLALANVHQDTRSDLIAAIDQVNDVFPSPVFQFQAIP